VSESSDQGKKEQGKKEKERLFLIDGGHTLYRAYHAIRDLTTSRGFPTNAIYGFTQTLQKVIRDHRPEYVAVVFDAPGPTFRHAMYAAYKANRPAMPEDLAAQIPLLRELLQAYRIPSLELPGYEGDDLIGTLAARAAQAGIETVIVSGDKDLCQLVDRDVRILDPRKDRLVGPEEVFESFGVRPDQIQDLLALAGDTIDNLPGVPGIGPKTAAALLAQFGSIESLIARVDEIEKPRIRELVRGHLDRIRINRRLVELDRAAPIEIPFEQLRREEPDTDRLRELFIELEFHKLLEELPEKKCLSSSGYRTVLDEGALERLASEMAGCLEGFAVDLETTSRLPSRADIVGISVCTGDGRAYYIPIAHSYVGAPAQVPLEAVKRLLGPALLDERLPKFGQNIKYDLLVLKRNSIEVKGVAFDTMVASYVLDPSRRSHSLDALAREFLHHTMISYSEVTGGGSVGFEKVPVEKATVYSCEDAHATYLLVEILGKRIREEGFEGLLKEIEIPLIEVLTDMEYAGVKIDVDFFRDLSREFHGQLRSLEERIYESAGEAFNVNSPQQLGRILFEKMRLPRPRKTKTGYATDVKVLSRLAREHPLPQLVLEYRSLSKLISTYVDVLPKLVHPVTGRIHTSYNQTVTATGRLSSSDPNLQNIPVRSAEGKRIREGFVPEDGMVIVSADYNQVELRILAHLSGDKRLLAAYEADEDVHARTAAELFGVAPELVSDEMRRQAKVINFGVIYGMGPYGLAEELRIPRARAHEFIENYFATYTGVRDYREACLEEARAKGYVTTLFNRRRYLPELASKDPAARSLAERTAINTPIQGTAADIIKVAMIRIHRELRARRLRSRIIMQVHDELVLEVPEEEVPTLVPLVRRQMEGVVELRIPLKVDVHVGRNWSEAH
jgi:DNA polymerase-1